MLIDEGTTVGVWAQKWLDVYCKNAMGEGCYQNYAGIVKNQIAPRIGALKLKDVRPIHCQSVLNAEIGRSTSFLSKIRQVMFRMFKYAKREGVIDTNPADDLCPYCLRHTYGTDLQDAGVPINVAKYLMGHSDITTTANIYTDTTDDSIESAREKINNKLCMSNCMSLEKEA